MRNDKLLQHPVLQVKIAGKEIDERPVSFKMNTDKSNHYVSPYIVFPAGFTADEGESITVSLVQDDITSLLFTDEIFTVDSRKDCCELNLIDGYKKLVEATVTPAYRK